MQYRISGQMALMTDRRETSNKGTCSNLVVYRPRISTLES